MDFGIVASGVSTLHLSFWEMVITKMLKTRLFEWINDNDAHPLSSIGNDHLANSRWPLRVRATAETCHWFWPSAAASVLPVNDFFWLKKKNMKSYSKVFCNMQMTNRKSGLNKHFDIFWELFSQPLLLLYMAVCVSNASAIGHAVQVNFRQPALWRYCRWNTNLQVVEVAFKSLEYRCGYLKIIHYLPEHRNVYIYQLRPFTSVPCMSWITTEKNGRKHRPVCSSFPAAFLSALNQSRAKFVTVDPAFMVKCHRQ